jgi:hypothetical protein
VRVPHLFPTTLTTDEQRLVLRATVGNVRDHTIISLALGTGLRLAKSSASTSATCSRQTGSRVFGCACEPRSPRADGRRTCSSQTGSSRS